MYQEHKCFKSPDNDSVKIWNYMNYDKFVKLLENKAFFFVRPEFFKGDENESCHTDADFKAIHDLRNNCKGEDREVALTEFYNQDSDSETISFLKYLQDNCKDEDRKVGLTRLILKMRSSRTKKEIVIKCFHMNKYESEFMWRTYTKNGTKSEIDVAIQSNFKRLKDCFNNSNCIVYFGEITYNNETSKILLGNDYLPYLHKRENFLDDKEIRAIVSFEDTQKEEITEKEEEIKGMYVKISLDTFIEKIYVSSTSPDGFLDDVKSFVKEHGLTKEVVPSELSNKPLD